MNLPAWAFQHRRSILFLIALLVAAGVASLFQIPVSLFPQVSFPRIRISLDAGDRPAERMQMEVTMPIEEAVRAIPSVRGVRSTTSRGSAEISISFSWGDDMDKALLQVQAAVNRLLPLLPAGTAFSVERMDPTVFPVIAYSITSKNHSPVELRDLALYTLRPALTTTPGVARVVVQGGETEEYRVTADPDKLQALGLTVSDLATALSASNVLTAVGRLEENHKLYLVISDTRFQTMGAISKTVLRSNANGVVRLDDVARVERSAEPQWIRVTADGRDAVILQVYQQPGGNTVEIAAAIKDRLQKLGPNIPRGVTLKNWYDQSELISFSAASARDAILLGVFLAALILLVFLRNWKITLIAAITAPAVLTTSVLLLNVLGMSLNIMTLGGMAAAVGLIIDDAIVMIEHIVRRVHETGGDFTEKMRNAAVEFTRPLTASSGATIVIFAPLAFLSGVTGAFFKALSLTMAASLVISFFITLFAVPILAAWLLRATDKTVENSHSLVNRIYGCLMTRLFARPWLVLLIIVPLLAAGWAGMQYGESGFMPVMDEGGFILDYLSAPGTSLSETDRMIGKVEAILQATSEVATYSRRTGLGLGGGLNEANSGDFFVRLKPQPRRGIEEIMTDVRNRIESSTPGLHIELLQLMEDLIGDLTSVPQPIEIKLFSEDAPLLDSLAPRVADTISKIPGIVEVNNGVIPAGDALNVSVDRVKASLEGADPEAVTRNIEDLLTGNIATTVQNGPKLINVRVWIPGQRRQSSRDIANLQLRAPDGHLFPLRRVATFSALSGQPEITREDLRRMCAVTARISGRDLGSAVHEVQRILDKPGVLPPGVTYTMGGLYEQQQIAFHDLTIVLLVAAALVFLLLLFLYESFRVSGAMLFIALLGVAAVYAGLWITGTEFNVTSRMGMTMTIGIITEVSIFYFSEFRSLPWSPDRFIRAGLNRLRPIAMTTFAAILALAPLAFGIGEGSAMLQPLAIAIIAGLILQIPLVLVVLPVTLSWLGEKC